MAVGQLRLLICLLGVGLTWAAPQMFIWNCDGCTYGTQTVKAGVDFDAGSSVSGDLSVEHILAANGANSLEIRGPLDGLTTSRALVRIHEGGDCNSEIMHEERCNDCQSFMSIKVLASRKLLTIGGENDVINRALSIVDTRRGTQLACGVITAPPSP